MNCLRSLRMLIYMIISFPNKEGKKKVLAGRQQFIGLRDTTSKWNTTSQIKGHLYCNFNSPRAMNQKKINSLQEVTKGIFCSLNKSP